jgi:pyroglutamyl-peptidase
MRVLVTGFGAFDGGSNASEAALRAIESRRAALAGEIGAAVDCLLLDVDTVRGPERLSAAVAELRPTHVLATGQAAGRNRVTLERFAINWREFATSDAAGRLMDRTPVVAGGPAAYAATWPDLEGAVAALQGAGIPAAVSNHAGTHLCNQTLYSVLHGADARGPLATFLHLPVLPEQVIRGEPATLRHPACPYLPIEMAVRAVETLLRRLPPQEKR